jgi:hypothetical protein
VITGGYNHNVPTWPSASYFTGNLILPAGSSFPQPNNSPIGPCYFVRTSAGTFLNAAAGTTHSGHIFQKVSGTNSGNAQQLICANAAGAVSLKNLMFLRCPTDGKGSGQGVNMGGSPAVTVEHCLFWGNQTGGELIHIGEYSAAVAGNVTSCRSNIIFSPTAGTTCLAIAESVFSTFTLDAVTVAGYNVFKNQTSGTNKYNAGASSATVQGYSQLEVTNASPFPNAAIGTGDQLVDPQFTDTGYRDVIQWANQIGGQAATWPAANAYLLANPWLVGSMMTWVRQGYIPTNPALLNATYPDDPLTTDANGNPLNGNIGPMGPLPVAGSIYASQLNSSTLRTRGRVFTDARAVALRD